MIFPSSKNVLLMITSTNSNPWFERIFSIVDLSIQAGKSKTKTVEGFNGFFGSWSISLGLFGFGTISLNMIGLSKFVLFVG